MKELWVQVVAVAVGGALGAAARFAVSRLARTYIDAALPYGTLLVNITGSLLLGILAGLVAAAVKFPPFLFALLGTGFCGAFTTFSTFATETLASNSFPVALINILANNLLALAAAALGLYIGHALGS